MLDDESLADGWPTTASTRTGNDAALHWLPVMGSVSGNKNMNHPKRSNYYENNRRCKMRHITKIVISLLPILYLTGCGQQQQKPIENIVAAYPDNAKVVFENDYVQAVEFKLTPGDKLPLHKGAPRAVYAISDYRIKWIEGNETTEKEWHKGDIHWHDGIEHAVENMGATDAQYLVVNRTVMPLPETADSDLLHDASQIDSGHSQIVLENEHLRVIEVKLPPGESQPMHDGLNRLIYSLTDYNIEYSYYKVNETVNKIERKMEEGFVHWHTPDRHSVKNIGNTLADYLVFAFKK
jgi:hypothetical protein